MYQLKSTSPKYRRRVFFETANCKFISISKFTGIIEKKKSLSPQAVVANVLINHPLYLSLGYGFDVNKNNI